MMSGTQSIEWKKNFLVKKICIFRCRFRILDSFGTEPAFNLGTYARSRGYITQWGSWSLHPLQYMTMFRKSEHCCDMMCSSS